MFVSEGINLDGILVGASLMAIMWIGRMACIKGEYYFTKKLWMAFLAVGIISVASALFVESVIFSSILSIFGFTFLWGIHEIIEQEERVSKGWFPKRTQNKKDA
jgi:membrane glycosyltransferase